MPFKFHNLDLGEFISATTMGLPDEPQSFLLPQSTGALCMALLTGRLPGAESSYFYGRWSNSAVKAESKSHAELARQNCAIDITHPVMTSLRKIAQYRGMVPNAGIHLPLTTQQVLLRNGLASYVEYGGADLPLTSLSMVYALAELPMPLSEYDRCLMSLELVNRLSKRLGGREVSMVSDWAELRGPEGRVNRVEFCLEQEIQPVVLTFDEQVGTTLRSLFKLLGSGKPVERKVAPLYWG